MPTAGSPPCTGWRLCHEFEGDALLDEITTTMRRALDLIGISDPGQLEVESATLAESHPLRRVDDLLADCLRDIAGGERVMRAEIRSLKQAADQEVTLLDGGFAATGWPVYHAGKVETGRQQLLRGFELVGMLAPLRRLLHTAPGTGPAPPQNGEPGAPAAPGT
jgi:hypothetical protein